jgi:hypothetical protein
MCFIRAMKTGAGSRRRVFFGLCCEAEALMVALVSTFFGAFDASLSNMHVF